MAGKHPFFLIEVIVSGFATTERTNCRVPMVPTGSETCMVIVVAVAVDGVPLRMPEGESTRPEGKGLLDGASVQV